MDKTPLKERGAETMDPVGVDEEESRDVHLLLLAGMGGFVVGAVCSIWMAGRSHGPMMVWVMCGVTLAIAGTAVFTALRRRVRRRRM